MSPFQDDPDSISWRLHLDAPPEEAYRMVAGAEGRRRFWAESAPESGGVIQFVFPNGWEYAGRITHTEPPTLFQVEYFGSQVTFHFKSDPAGGTELELIDRGVSNEDRTEVIAGWVSVLMSLKAVLDFGVDLRNHDPTRTWEQGYANN